MPLDLDAIRARAEAARTMVSDLCKPLHTKGYRRWIMSIPARPDHDPDLVIAVSLGDIPALIARVRELEEALSAAASVQRAQAQANAMSIREADELRAEIANERGEGDGPSEGWRYDAGTWLYGVDEDGDRLPPGGVAGRVETGASL